MRTRFIHDDFELDVSDFEISWTEENTWFKDEFFLSSSFPFELDYDFIPYFSKYRHDNLATTDTYFKGRLEKDGKLEDAILEVEEAEKGLRLTIRYGAEALPNWDKLLSELVLDVVLPNGGDMIGHAGTMLNKTWPEVNYNFPAIHTDSYEGATMFEHFEGTINKRKNGQFIFNTADGSDTENHNIVYPFPYHMYVLQKVIEDAGCTLHGDILNDESLKKSIIYSGKKIVEFEHFPAPVDWPIGIGDKTSDSGWPWRIQTWYSELEVNYRGDFRLTGSINNETKIIKLRLNGTVVWEFHEGDPLNMLLFFSTTSASNIFTVDILSVGITNPNSKAAEFNLTTFQIYDEDGNPVPFLANFINVQLADKLPDMSVGDFIKFHKRLKNYDFDIRNGNEIWMNLVQNEVLNSEIVDISEFQPPAKTRKFEQAKSFLLQYEGEFENYTFNQIYADRDGFAVNDFVKAENTEEITINGIPLPVETRDQITTAVQLSDDAAKMMIIKYDGLQNGQNWAQPYPELDTIVLFQNYWQRWLNFMIHAVKFLWTIRAHPNDLMKVKRKSKLFSFNNLMFVFALNRRRAKDVEEVEIEAYSSKI